MKPTAMHPLAEQELDEVTDYYAAIEVDLAEAFVDCFASSKDRITEHPLHSPKREGLCGGPT